MLIGQCLLAFFYWFGRITSWPLQWIYFRKKVYYEDKKITSRYIKGPALLVSNHRSLKDFMMAMFLFPFHKLYCLMSELIFGHGGFVSFMTRIVGGVRVDRASFDFSFMDKAMKLFEKKKLLIIYPEAKISTTNKMLPFHPTYILLALKSGVPIIPIYTDGRYRFKQRCHVVIGKAIDLRDYCNTDNPTKEEISYLNDMVKNKIRELERICAKEVNKARYNQGFHFKYFFRDLGRFLAFTMNVHFKVKVHNKGKHKRNLRLKGGGVIVANHRAFTDPLVLLCAFWRRRVYVLAAEVVFDGHPIRSWLLTKLGCIRIDRRINDFDTLQKCIDILAAGNLLIVFPGGSINHTSTLEEFKGGASLMATQANVPLYPVFIGERTSKLGRNPIYLGEKIDVASLRTTNRMNTNDLNNISSLLYNSIKELEEKSK